MIIFYDKWRKDDNNFDTCVVLIFFCLYEKNVVAFVKCKSTTLKT